MTGLLLKDVMVVRKQLRFILVFLIAYGGLAISENNVSMFMYMAVMFGVFLPTTSIGYDDRAEWNKYALCMPIKRSNIVISKYILGGIGLGVGILFSVLIELIYNSSLSEETLMLLFGISCAAILVISLYIPITFRFGIERSRFIILGIIFVPIVIAMLLFKGKELPDLDNLPVELLFGVIGASVLLFLLISILISIHILNKKEY